jgi:uncharacterized protein YbjT (DUF2867 family)
MTFERVFVVGGTGNIGKRCVKDLLANKVAVTLYARNPDKANKLFTQGTDLLSIVQGDFTDLSVLQESIKEHSRLLLLVADHSQFVKTKLSIARYAYEAGVKQIVDISSFTVNIGWRTSTIGSIHYLAEKAIYDLPDRGNFVALRCGRFMSNHFHMQSPIKDGAIFDITQPDRPIGWISTEDIGAVAAVILREDISKHGDGVYNLTGEVLTLIDRAAALSRILDKEIKYQTISPVELYKRVAVIGHFPHLLAVDMVDNMTVDPLDFVNPIIEILLDRKPQTFEEYISENKASLK